MSELKPCPFCGSTDVEAKAHGRYNYRTETDSVSWYIFCTDCDMICGYSTIKEAIINRWNERVVK